MFSCYQDCIKGKERTYYVHLTVILKDKVRPRSCPENIWQFLGFRVAYSKHCMSCFGHITIDCVMYLECLPRPSTCKARLCTCSYTGGSSTLVWHDGLIRRGFVVHIIICPWYYSSKFGYLICIMIVYRNINI